MLLLAQPVTVYICMYAHIRLLIHYLYRTHALFYTTPSTYHQLNRLQLEGSG